MSKTQFDLGNIAYFDAAATSLMPTSVADAMANFAKKNYASVHRSAYARASLATTHFEAARAKIATYFQAENVIINRGCTEGLNTVIDMVAQHWQEDDEVIVSIFDHHSSFVPMQQNAIQKKVRVHIVPYTKNLSFDYDYFASVVNEKTRCVCVTHLSNVTGTLIDIKKIHDILTQKGVRNTVRVIIDGAQSAVHTQPSFKELHADAYICSAHKMYGPTGVGATLLSAALLDEQPVRFGGQMIADVTVEQSLWAKSPFRFEPGTPPVLETVAWAHALDFIHQQKDTTQEMLHKAHQTVQKHATIYASPNPVGCFSFTIPNAHAHDVAALCDDKQVCIRAGHLCAQPLLHALGHDALLRVSVGLYTDDNDITVLDEALTYAKKVLQC